MNKGAELLRWGLAGKQNDLASVAHTQRRGYALFVLKQDALGCDEVEQAFLPLSYIATDPAGKLGKLQAFRLRDILSRDLRPARVRPVSRATPVDPSTATHGHWNCYGDFHREESF